MRMTARRSLERGVLATVDDARARLGYLRSTELRTKNRSLGRRNPRWVSAAAPGLVYAVAGHFDVSAYIESGVDHARFIRERLRAAGVEIEQVGALLDFGCGCGRVLHVTGTS